jgi:antitoxin component YwqK of YwqJK toxin-antitoxin module
MLSTKLIRMLTLGLALAAPAAMAGDTAAKLNCPAGTAQAGNKAEGFTCVKANVKAETQVAHGAYVEYHPNGKLKTQGQFENGLKVGTWTFYDEAGNMRSTAEFKAGGWDGQRVMYFPSGKPRLIEVYRDGKKNGVAKELAEDGRVVSQVRYADNRAVANE